MTKAILSSLTKKQVNQIKHICDKKGSISSATFNQIVNQKSDKKQLPKSRTDPFNFVCTISSPSADEVIVRFDGRHYSKNDIDSFHFKRKLAYKKSIKEAFANALLIQGKKALPKKPFTRVLLNVEIRLRKSRDDDSPQETSKRMRDCCIGYIIAEDDRRTIKDTKYTEVITNHYAMTLTFKNIEDTNDQI